ncbi:MAG TPA: SDR family oxidoreductase [Alphaproteobacteria bacterium]|nr:SDR family oxidoreductase [Alphaproteobacteria bacterium]
MAGRLFVFGLGYSARTLARHLLDADPGEKRGAEGWTVAGTSRSEAGVAALARSGIEAYPFSSELPLNASGLGALAAATHIVSSVPPGETGDPVLGAHGDAIASGGAAWIGYLSTTGVYGNTGGEWVDEGAPVRPSGPRGERRAAAERAWLALGASSPSGKLPVHIFRIAGIYGPGRNALAQLRAGTAKRTEKPGHIFSRIHVADIAGVLAASMAQPNPGAIYNLCDDRPAPGPDVVTFAASLLGVEPPPLVPIEQAELSAMAASFYADNRRVRNERIKQELGVRLAYPDYEAGLRALYEAGEGR